MAANADNIVIGAATITIAGSDIGYTSGPSVIRFDMESRDIMAEQAIGVVRKAKISERAYITIPMMELTLSNLRRALMLPTANLAGSVLTLGYNDSCWTDEVAITAVSFSPSCGTRTWSFPTCVTINSKEYTMSRAEESVLELEYEILKDSSGNFGTLTDS